MNGLMEGQVLLHVNGKDIQQLTFEDIVHLIDKSMFNNHIPYAGVCFTQDCL